MRNWNSASGLSFPERRSFQTTYEELKQINPHEPVSSCRFQTTYEELKHRPNIRRDNQAVCFQTTYEELKRPESRYLALYNASRLPMRNWNSLCRPITCNVTASRLPMRNWNPEPKKAPGFPGALPDYLWGIETALALLSHSLASRFQTTYEELKPVELDLELAGLRLPDYLWGIETYELRGWFGRSSRFQTTYEELKL